MKDWSNRRGIGRGLLGQRQTQGHSAIRRTTITMTCQVAGMGAGGQRYKGERHVLDATTVGRIFCSVLDVTCKLARHARRLCVLEEESIVCIGQRKDRHSVQLAQTSMMAMNGSFECDHGALFSISIRATALFNLSKPEPSSAVDCHRGQSRT